MASPKYFASAAFMPDEARHTGRTILRLQHPFTFSGLKSRVRRSSERDNADDFGTVLATSPIGGDSTTAFDPFAVLGNHSGYTIYRGIDST